MKTTADFLDALRVKLEVPSDYALGTKMQMHRQQMSRYRTLNSTFDDAMSLRVAEILELEPAFVVACMHHQRAKEPAEKTLWQNIAERFEVPSSVYYVKFTNAIKSTSDRRHHIKTASLLAGIFNRRHDCAPTDQDAYYQSFSH